MLDFSNVSHTYKSPAGELKALEEINLKIEEGSFVCLLGPSGCGKTSLLNMAAGFIRPAEGRVLYKGKDVTTPSRDRSVVFQDAGLVPWLSVEQNIVLALKDCIREESHARACDVLKTTGLKGFNNSMPHELSGGMRQKVAIARALAMESSLMLMDEPFSSLDEQTRLRLNREMVDIWRSRKNTVLFITHSIQEAVVMGSRIVLLTARPGKISGEWFPEDLGFSGLERQQYRLNNSRFHDMTSEIRDSMELCCPPGVPCDCEGDSND